MGRPVSATPAPMADRVLVATRQVPALPGRDWGALGPCPTPLQRELQRARAAHEQLHAVVEGRVVATAEEISRHTDCLRRAAVAVSMATLHYTPDATQQAVWRAHPPQYAEMVTAALRYGKHPALATQWVLDQLFRGPTAAVEQQWVGINVTAANSSPAGDVLGDWLIEATNTWLDSQAEASGLRLFPAGAGTSFLLVGGLAPGTIGIVFHNFVADLTAIRSVRPAGDGFVPTIAVGRVSIKTPLIEGKPVCDWVAELRTLPPESPRHAEVRAKVTQATLAMQRLIDNATREAAALSVLAEEMGVDGLTAATVPAERQARYAELLRTGAGVIPVAKYLPILHDAERLATLSEMQKDQLALMQLARPGHEVGLLRMAIDQLEQTAGLAVLMLQSGHGLPPVSREQLGNALREVSRLFYLGELAERHPRYPAVLDFEVPAIGSAAERQSNPVTAAYARAGCTELTVIDVDSMKACFRRYPPHSPEAMPKDARFIPDDSLSFLMARAIQLVCGGYGLDPVLAKNGDTWLLGHPPLSTPELTQQMLQSVARDVARVYRQLVFEEEEKRAGPDGRTRRMPAGYLRSLTLSWAHRSGVVIRSEADLAVFWETVRGGRVAAAAHKKAAGRRKGGSGPMTDEHIAQAKLHPTRGS